MATWLEDVVAAMRNLGGRRIIKKLYREVSYVRDEPLPNSVDEPVRATIYKHSSDSRAYNQDKTDYFTRVKSGVWRLRNRFQSENAQLIAEAKEKIERLSEKQKAELREELTAGDG